jgi:hypothetical protein
VNASSLRLMTLTFIAPLGGRPAGTPASGGAYAAASRGWAAGARGPVAHGERRCVAARSWGLRPWRYRWRWLSAPDVPSCAADGGGRRRQAAAAAANGASAWAEVARTRAAPDLRGFKCPL